MSKPIRLGRRARHGNTKQQGRGTLDAERECERDEEGRHDERRQSAAATHGVESKAADSESTTQSQTTQIASNANASTPRGGDQQRELRTTQERGSARPSPSPRRPDLDQGNDIFSQLNSLAGASPFAVMRRMMEDMDRLFSPFGTAQAPRGQQGLQRGGGQRALPPLSRGLWAPQVEVFDRGNNLVVRAELPGLSREDVDVEVDDDALVIRGERHNDVEDEHDGYYRSERSYGSFYRAIPLPEGVDPNACNANFKDGVLEVTLPKPARQVSRARKISVK